MHCGCCASAVFAQRDPLAALKRGHHAYIHDQRYTAKPSTAEVAQVLSAVLDILLGATGVDEILAHPWARLHVITSQGRGLAGNGRRTALVSALTIAAVLNLVGRASLSRHFRRVIFSNAGANSPLRDLRDLPTLHVELSPSNLRDALRASGSIPMVIDGVPIASAPGGLHWDGGVTDYHLDLDYAAGDGLVLYPHFVPYIVPGWFDKTLTWRRARVANHRRTLLISPSDEFVATLPGKRIPDRRDFFAMTDRERVRAWKQVRLASAALGDELGELVSSGRIASRVEAWG